MIAGGGIRAQGVPVSIERVSKSYGDFVAVKDVSIAVEAGTIVSLLGPSGCGKTTVLRMVAGLTMPDSGIIQIGDRVLNDVPVWKRGIGLVFQSYALFPHMTVAENIGFGLRMRGIRGREAGIAIAEAMDLTRLSGLADRLPSQLSGGQRQRVALARAVVTSPDVLLLDEPLGALDKKLRDQMQVELKLLQRRVGLSTIIVTHDQDEALTLSDRVVVMSNGCVEQAATPHEIYRRPKNAFVAGFIGAANLLPAVATGREGGVTTARLSNGQTIRAAHMADDCKPHGELNIIVRPENISLGGDAGSTQNSLQGRVINSLFSGSTTTFVIDADGYEMKVSVPGGKGDGAPTIANGETVHLVWAPEDTLIVGS